ncbi:Ureidoglycolate lyase [Frondihabitans sp. 762G35]|nr:Ureidoglycolate lyase [Frondihabitans sp. 762G35]
MTDDFQRLGPVGAEIPVYRNDGTAYDLRPVTADIDRAWFARGGFAEARAAHAAGRLPVLGGGVDPARGRSSRAARQDRLHRPELPGPRRGDRCRDPRRAVVFMKDPTTIVGPSDTVLIPRGSTKTDWEVELGIVIGSEARYLDSPADARACIAGYVLSHDVSEREFQLERGGSGTRARAARRSTRSARSSPPPTRWPTRRPSD